MKTIIWIQNSNEDYEDFMYDDDTLINTENIEDQQNHISKILTEKKRAKTLLDKDYLKIYQNYKHNSFLIEHNSDDLDNYGRKGAVLIYIKDYVEERDSTSLKDRFKKIFFSTGTKVSDKNIEAILSSIKKKKISLKVLLLVLSLLLSLFILYFIEQN